LAGWKPPAKGSSDILTDQDLLNLLGTFPGGERVTAAQG
jgi:hypothetical protein